MMLILLFLKYDDGTFQKTLNRRRLKAYLKLSVNKKKCQSIKTLKHKIL